MRRNGTRMTRVLRIRADLLVRLERNNRAVSVAYMARFPGFLTAPLIRAAWTRLPLRQAGVFHFAIMPTPRYLLKMPLTICLKAGSASFSNQGFFLIQILFLGEG